MSEQQKGAGNAALVAMLVCGAAVAIFFVGGANAWTAIAVVGLALMGVGMAFFMMRK